MQRDAEGVAGCQDQTHMRSTASALPSLSSVPSNQPWMTCNLAFNQYSGRLPRAMASRCSKMRAPSSRMPLCMYSFVTHCRMPRMCAAVSCMHAAHVRDAAPDVRRRPLHAAPCQRCRP